MHDSAVLPSDPQGQKLASIFCYGWKWLELDPESPAPEWRTNNKFPLKPRVFWRYWQDAKRIIGVRFGSKTSYAMLDIDKNSQYLNLIPQIKAALETIGIVRTITIQSSYSGGIHLYMPLPEKFPSFSVACAIKQCLSAHGFELATGQLESFPNEKRYAESWRGEFCEYAGHRAPLQPDSGSKVLDDDLNPIAVHNQLSHFLAAWDNAALANNASEITEALNAARSNRRRRGHRRRTGGKLATWQADLNHSIAEGWTGPGQTNGLLKDLACYGVVFEGLRGAELADYIEAKAIAAPGYREHCQHQRDIKKRAIAWGRSGQFYWWPAGELPTIDRTKLSYNQYRQTEARERIAGAVRLIKHQALAVRDLAAAIVAEAQCSFKTLYRHPDLWHPNRQGVTAPPVGAVESLADIQRQVRESLESVDTASVTPCRGFNEVSDMKSPPENLPSSGGGVGVTGAGRGLSPAWPPPVGWQTGAGGGEQ